MKNMLNINFHDATIQPRMHEQACAFVARGIGNNTGFGPCASMGVSRDGNLLGAVIFHDWQPDRETVEMSVHGEKGWISRRVVNAAMSYIFDGLNCQMVVGQAASTNAAALALDRRIFANEVVIPRLMGRNTDGHIFSLTHEQWLSHRLYTPPEKV